MFDHRFILGHSLSYWALAVFAEFGISVFQAPVQWFRLTKRCSRPRQPYTVCQGQKFREAAAAAELGR